MAEGYEIRLYRDETGVGYDITGNPTISDLLGLTEWMKTILTIELVAELKKNKLRSKKSRAAATRADPVK